MFSNNGQLHIPVSGGTSWVRVPMSSNYPSQTIGIDGNKYAPVSEVNKTVYPSYSTPVAYTGNRDINTELSIQNYEQNYARRKELEEQEKRQQEAFINKQLDIAASAQYNIMDKLYKQGGMDEMRKEYYRLCGGTEGSNSVYARAAYNALCAKDKEEAPIKEETTKSANNYYNEGGIDNLKYLINFYKSRGEFNYASVAQSVLNAKEKEEAINTPAITKSANEYYETGGMEGLKHLVKYYDENSYPVNVNIAKRILKQKEEQEREEEHNRRMQQDPEYAENYKIKEAENEISKLEKEIVEAKINPYLKYSQISEIVQQKNGFDHVINIGYEKGDAYEKDLRRYGSRFEYSRRGAEVALKTLERIKTAQNKIDQGKAKIQEIENVRTERVLKQKEEQEHEKLKQNFDTAIQEAERILKLNDIDVPREKVIQIFNEHLDLKLSEKGIEDSLVKLGWVGSNETGLPSDRKDAFIRGVQQFVYQNRNKFIKNSEGYSGTSTEKQVMEPINPDNIVQKIKEINEFFEVIMPRDFADMADDILHKRSHNDLGEDFDDKVSKTLKSTFEGVKGKFVETGEFIGEEIARLHLGEKTKTRQRLEYINIFLEEEKERFDTGQTTKTGQALKDFGSYLKNEGELIVANEKTQTEQFVRDTYRKIKDTPAEDIGHEIGKLGGEMLIGFGIFKGASTLVNGTGKVVNAVKTTKRSASLAEVRFVKDSLLKEKTLNNHNSKPIVTQYNNHNANNVNAQKALNKKMSALEEVQKIAVKVESLSDGRIRYYTKEVLSANPGPTRGAAYVTEYNPKNGQVRSWMECYDHFGNVNRVHPKTIDGQDIIGQHYPPTKKELEFLLKNQNLELK